MSGGGKSGFRNLCLEDADLLVHDPTIPQPIIEGRNYFREVRASVQLVDLIVWFKSIGGTNSSDGKENTARGAASMIAQAVRALLKRRQVVVLVVDKDNVPVTKGVVQSERNDASLAVTRSASADSGEQNMTAEALVS